VRGTAAETEGSVVVGGGVSPGFEEVRAEFERNFAERGELGAACAAYHAGEKVVDLWGGYRDEKERVPWEEDTLVLVFSTTKGVAGMAVALAHSRGFFEYDEPVARYWPEFAEGGKERVTVRQLLSHQAGLCAVDEPLTPEVLTDLDAVARAIARQRPAWEPGMRHGYHGITLGFYEGELIRRVDPERRSLGRFFREEIAKPLGLEFYIGLPPDVPDDRIATIKDFHPARMLLHFDTLPWPFVRAVLNPRSLSSRSLRNPKLNRPVDLGGPVLRHSEIPAGNGIGRVRAIARAYSVFASGGGELGIGRETLEALTEPASPPKHGTFDEVLRVETSYALGYMKPFPAFRFGGNRSFGTPGMGGSFGFADPDARVGFAYAPNRSGYHLWDDPREKALRDALYRCLERL
jgi:CubicO group peptidase (beta-lactamase class C family)